MYWPRQGSDDTATLLLSAPGIRIALINAPIAVHFPLVRGRLAALRFEVVRVNKSKALAREEPQPQSLKIKENAPPTNHYRV
jgi:hypothetical protein